MEKPLCIMLSLPLTALLVFAGCSSSTAPSSTSSVMSGSSLASGETSTDSPDSSSTQNDANANSSEIDISRFQVHAVNFTKAWYGDWSMVGDAMQIAKQDAAERCAQYVAPGSSAENTIQQLSGEYRAAALCATDVVVVSMEGDTIQVLVSYVGTQNNVSRDKYDEMKQSPFTRTLALSYRKDGLIYDIEGLE